MKLSPISVILSEEKSVVSGGGQRANVQIFLVQLKPPGAFKERGALTGAEEEQEKYEKFHILKKEGNHHQGG